MTAFRKLCYLLFVLFSLGNLTMAQCSKNDFYLERDIQKQAILHSWINIMTECSHILSKVNSFDSAKVANKDINKANISLEKLEQKGYNKYIDFNEFNILWKLNDSYSKSYQQSKKNIIDAMIFLEDNNLLNKIKPNNMAISYNNFIGKTEIVISEYIHAKFMQEILIVRDYLSLLELLKNKNIEDEDLDVLEDKMKILMESLEKHIPELNEFEMQIFSAFLSKEWLVITDLYLKEIKTMAENNFYNNKKLMYIVLCGYVDISNQFIKYFNINKYNLENNNRQSLSFPNWISWGFRKGLKKGIFILED
ncbi:MULTISPECIES: hypothetical protein [unclassified Akkermansia]|jgi:hypothetical protein|uniref:hypothetical protein n=1 Tax=unclassified Akkermansia TaxID=2608915 RepID=UPI000A79CF02|nr:MULTISPECIES: hypothetical protein [unclassified Akkermansia]